LELHFFGLTPSYKLQVYKEIHDLVFHGNGGFIHSEVYCMPVWLRRFHIDRINKYHKTQKEEYNKASQSNSSSSPKPPKF
jgi:hypothetical protein